MVDLILELLRVCLRAEAAPLFLRPALELLAETEPSLLWGKAAVPLQQQLCDVLRYPQVRSFV